MEFNRKTVFILQKSPCKQHYWIALDIWNPHTILNITAWKRTWDSCAEGNSCNSTADKHSFTNRRIKLMEFLPHRAPGMLLKHGVATTVCRARSCWDRLKLQLNRTKFQSESKKLEASWNTPPKNSLPDFIFHKEYAVSKKENNFSKYRKKYTLYNIHAYVLSAVCFLQLMKMPQCLCDYLVI